MRPHIWLSFSGKAWLEFAVDDSGTISVSRIAARTCLRPASLTVGRVGLFEGITIEDIRSAPGSTLGLVQELALPVNGDALPPGPADDGGVESSVVDLVSSVDDGDRICAVDNRFLMRPHIWLSFSGKAWLEFAADHSGTISISRIAARTCLRPDSLTVGRVGLFEGITIEDIRSAPGSTLGLVQELALPVNGDALPPGPAGRALRDNTAVLLEKLIQPFDRIPESLDVVELRSLLTTDLRIKIPCLSYALASSFEDCLQHSTIEECPRLESLLASFLIGTRRPVGSSENALISLWDRLVADLPQLIHEVLNFPISSNRNVVDESLSTYMDRRDYLLYLQTLPVVFGEEKRYDNEMSEAVDDLRKKHKGVPGKHIYGRLGYVMCYAAAGQSRFQFFAVPVGIAYPEELIALTRVIDPSLRIGRVELLKTFVNVIRWIYTVRRQELIGGLSLHNFYAPFRRPSPYDIGEVEITLFANHVKKLFEVPTKHLDTLLHVYRVLCSEKIRCSIQLERMTVDGRVHLPGMEVDLEETDSELSYVVVDLKLKPTARIVKPRDEPDSKFLVSCILKAIVDLHKHGICHRDIRMANILRTPSEWILIDFELAGRAGECVFWNSESLSRGSQYWEHQDLKQLADVIETLPSIAGLSLLQFAAKLRKMESAAQALSLFVAST